MRHVQDSLTLVPFLASAGAKRVIDVGSGGGLPGLPLAIAMPDVEFTLLEATGKKAAFLADTARALGCGNVRVVQERAEVAGQDHHVHRARYDVAVSRAVGRLNVLAELTVPFVREGGTVLCIKGAQAPEEVAEAKQALYRLHAQVADLVRTPTGTVTRVMMISLYSFCSSVMAKPAANVSRVFPVPACPSRVMKSISGSISRFRAKFCSRLRAVMPQTLFL